MDKPPNGNRATGVIIALAACLMLAGMTWLVTRGMQVVAERTLATETLPPTRPTLPQTLPPTRDPTLEQTPTSSATATHTPTATLTPTPQPALLPLIMRELRCIENGGFEEGTFRRWTTTGALAKSIVTEPVHDGAYAALLGDPSYDSYGNSPIGEGSVYQVFDVPSQGNPVLKVWYRIYSYDTVDYDYFAIDIRPCPDGDAERLWIDGRYIWSPGILWNSGWREATISLDNYRGQPVSVRLYNAMTNDDGYYNTWTYVDDISLEGIH